MDIECSGVVEYICSLSWVKFARSSEQKRVVITDLIKQWDRIRCVRGGCDDLGKVVLRDTRNDLGETKALVVHQIVQYL